MKTKLVLTATLTFVTMSMFAQSNDGRIPAKGFAVFERYSASDRRVAEPRQRCLQIYRRMEQHVEIP